MSSAKLRAIRGSFESLQSLYKYLRPRRPAASGKAQAHLAEVMSGLQVAKRLDCLVPRVDTVDDRPEPVRLEGPGIWLRTTRANRPVSDHIDRSICILSPFRANRPRGEGAALGREPLTILCSKEDRAAERLIGNGVVITAP